jgi:hypothetical protein
MLGVARKLGYGNLNFSTFIDTMRDKPSQQFKSRYKFSKDYAKHGI